MYICLYALLTVLNYNACLAFNVHVVNKERETPRKCCDHKIKRCRQHDFQPVESFAILCCMDDFCVAHRLPYTDQNKKLYFLIRFSALIRKLFRG